MVRLDRTIGVPKLALTGVTMPMVRSSRTMTGNGGLELAFRTILAPMGPRPAPALGLDPKGRLQGQSPRSGSGAKPGAYRLTARRAASRAFSRSSSCTSLTGLRNSENVPLMAPLNANAVSSPAYPVSNTAGNPGLRA